MAYIEIDIEDHLNEVSTAQLIAELKRRRLTKDDKKEIQQWGFDDDRMEAFRLLKIHSLKDVLKLEEFLETELSNT